MKIAQIIGRPMTAGGRGGTTDTNYGGKHSTYSLCRGLAERGHSVWLFCDAEPLAVEYADQDGITMMQMLIKKRTLSKPLRLLSYLPFSSFARRQKIDIIATQLSQAGSWGCEAGRLLKIPVVATIRSFDPAAPYEKADKIIAISEAVKQSLVEQGVPMHHIDVIYNGIDTERFKPTADIAAAKKRLDIDPEHIVFGVAARMSPSKGYKWFLEAAAEVAKQKPEVLFLLVGDGSQRRDLGHQIEYLGIASQVRFVGFQHNVVPWMEAMDVVVLPSHKEALGRVALEAGAMGKPVIASSAEGYRETVVPSHTGLVVPTGDVSALIQVILQLIENEDLRQRLGMAGKRHVQDHFTVEQMVLKTEKVYKDVLSNFHR